MHYVIESIRLHFVASFICILVLKVRIAYVLLIMLSSLERWKGTLLTILDWVFPVGFILYCLLFNKGVHLCGCECSICRDSESFYEHIGFILLGKYAWMRILHLKVPIQLQESFCPNSPPRLCGCSRILVTASQSCYCICSLWDDTHLSKVYI